MSAPATTSDTPENSLLRYSVCIGTILGVNVHVHYALPILTLVYSLTLLMYMGGLGFALGLVVYGPVLFFVVFCHEMGHAMAARKLGTFANDMLLWPLGGLMFVGQVPSVMSDLLVAVAGPATHIPLVLLGLAVLAASNDGSVEAGTIPSLEDNFWTVLCWEFLMMNILLFVFNLFVPAYPLDGGRALIDSLLLMGVAQDRAAIITVRVSCFLIVVLVIVGSWGLVSGLPSAVIYICTAAFLAQSTIGLHRHQVNGTLADHPLFQIPLRVKEESAVGTQAYTVNGSPSKCNGVTRGAAEVNAQEEEALVGSKKPTKGLNWSIFTRKNKN